MTYEVQQTRWDRLVRRVSGSIGPGSRVSETLSELFPVLDIERVPGELLALGGTKLCVGTAKVVPPAGNTGRVQLFNPVDSGNLVTISSVTVSSLSTAEINSAVRQIALSTDTGFNRFRDGRFPTPQRPVAQIRTQTSVAQTDPDAVILVNANNNVQISDSDTVAVLPPGSGLEYGAAANIITIIVTFRWRERPAEESELSL